MPKYEMLQLGLLLTWMLFVIAYGASVGSLINVLVYRMPRGISVVAPSSRCPKCGAKLRWCDNIPVLGWVMLLGKCRYCKNRISPEYPIVELSVGLLFALFYAIWYMMPQGQFIVLGFDLSGIQPDWARNDGLQTWPTFALLLLLLGSLVAMTLVDAKTFTIPLILTWVPAVAGIIVHTAHAAYLGPVVQYMNKSPGEVWAIPTPSPLGWGGIGAALGAALGLLLANVFLAFGLIRRSFADYADWERTITAAQPPLAQTPAQPPASAAAPGSDTASLKLAATPDAVLVSDPERPADLWIQYPHARREMLKEVVFLAPALALAMAGFHLARHLAGVSFDPITGVTSAAHQAPLWLTVLAGALLGYLIGGGVVWFVRILGSLAFGKEAMGLGDVHLMAAVGACLGWIDATLAFFGAAFVGIFWTLLSAVILRGGVKRAMPYGPFLAISTVLVLLCKPLIEAGLSALMHRPINIP